MRIFRGVWSVTRTLDPSSPSFSLVSVVWLLTLYRSRSWQDDDAVDAFLVKALAALATESSVDVLLPLYEVGEVSLRCMALLDSANTGAYGSGLTEVPLLSPVIHRCLWSRPA